MLDLPESVTVPADKTMKDVAAELGSSQPIKFYAGSKYLPSSTLVAEVDRSIALTVYYDIRNSREYQATRRLQTGATKTCRNSALRTMLSATKAVT